GVWHFSDSLDFINPAILRTGIVHSVARRGCRTAAGPPLVQPLPGRPGVSPRHPGCAARPWALGCDPFGVKRASARSRFLVLVALLAICSAGCNGCGRTPSVGPPAIAQKPAIPPPVVTFTDITEKAGIRSVHATGATGRKLMPESLGPGCAFIDYDGDGHPDLLLVN